MADSSRFDFCSRCGALARDGVCQSCGYQDLEIIQKIQQERMRQGQQPQPQQTVSAPQPQYYAGMQPAQPQPQLQQAVSAQQFYQGMPAQSTYQPIPPVQPEKSNKSTAVILGVVISLVVLIVIGLIAAGVVVIEKLFNTVDDDAFASYQEEEAEEDFYWEWEEEEADDTDIFGEENDSLNTTYTHYSSDVTQRNWEEEGQDESYPYYSGPYNALRDDLSYEISFMEQTYFSTATE